MGHKRICLQQHKPGDKIPPAHCQQCPDDVVNQAKCRHQVGPGKRYRLSEPPASASLHRRHNGSTCTCRAGKKGAWGCIERGFQLSWSGGERFHGDVLAASARAALLPSSPRSPTVHIYCLALICPPSRRCGRAHAARNILGTMWLKLAASTQGCDEGAPCCVCVCMISACTLSMVSVGPHVSHAG